MVIRMKIGAHNLVGNLIKSRAFSRCPGFICPISIQHVKKTQLFLGTSGLFVPFAWLCAVPLANEAVVYEITSKTENCSIPGTYHRGVLTKNVILS